MTLLRQRLASPRTTRFHRRHRAFAGGATGRTRRPAFVPHLAALEDRTLLSTLVVDQTGANGAYTTIQAAVTAAVGGDTIDIHPATYTEQVTIDKSLTMMGTAPGVIIQSPATLTPDPVLSLTALVEIDNGATVNMSDLTIQGPVPNGITIDAGILVVGGATANVTNSTIAHIRNETLNNISGTGYGILVGDVNGGAEVGTATITNDTIMDYQKDGILVGDGSTATITGNTIATAGPASVIAQNGIVIDANATATITGDTITGNQYTGPGSGPNPITNTPGAGIIVLGRASVTGNTVTGNNWGIYNASAGTTISGNTVQGSFEGILLDQGTATVSNNTVDGNNIGVAVIAYMGNTANSQGTLLSNNIFNNGNGGLSFPGAGISVLAESGATTTAQATAQFNRIVGNAVGLNNATTTAVNATLNWWGSNTGPNTTGNNTTTGTVNTSPWLVLSLSASPATIGPGATAVVTADLTKDSDGATHSTAPFFPDQIPIAFSATGGTIAPASVPTTSGMASSDFTSSTPGAASASVTLDNQTLSTPITIQAAPTVTALSPSNGPAAGGTLVTITGTGFTGAAAVDFGTTAATNLTVVSDSTITADSPAGTGVVNVTVTTPAGTSAVSAADEFTYGATAAPVVTGLSPTTASTVGGTSVTITGTSFTGATAVDFGTTAATNFTVVSDTTITAVSPAGTGTVDVTVVTPAGASPTSPAGQFTYTAVAPTVTGLSPTTGPAAGGTLVTITGTSFTGATAVNFGTTPATNLTVVNDTKITANSPAGTGTVNVTVITPAGTSPVATADQFTYAAATGPSVVPEPATGPTVVSLVRFGFHSQPTTLVLTFSAAMNPTQAQDVNNYQIMAPDGSVIPVTSAVYDASALTVTLHPSQLLNVHDFYQLTVNGTPPSGLTSATGVALNGAGNGTPGTKFVMTFSGEILAGPAPEMLRVDPKKYAAESKRMEAFVRTLTGTPHRMAATRKRLAAEAKKMVAVSARVAAQAARGDGPGAAAVDHLLGAGKVNVKGILAARKRGDHRVRSA